MEGASFVCTKDRQVSNGNLQDKKLQGRNFLSLSRLGGWASTDFYIRFNFAFCKYMSFPSGW